MGEGRWKNQVRPGPAPRADPKTQGWWLMLVGQGRGRDRRPCRSVFESLVASDFLLFKCMWL